MLGRWGGGGGGGGELLKAASTLSRYSVTVFLSVQGERPPINGAWYSGRFASMPTFGTATAQREKAASVADEFVRAGAHVVTHVYSVTSLPPLMPSEWKGYDKLGEVRAGRAVPSGPPVRFSPMAMSYVLMLLTRSVSWQDIIRRVIVCALGRGPE